MQGFRVTKRSVPLPRYRTLGDLICRTGVEMAPCPQCQRSGTTCVVRKGYKNCGPCTRKNMNCGGTFRQTEFDSLDRKRAELADRVRKGQQMMRVFMRQMVAQQKEIENAEKRLQEISRRMDVMVDREARALGELSELAPSAEEPEQEVMGFEDDFFLMDDPELLSWGLEPEPRETIPGAPSLPSVGPSGKG